MKADRVMIPFPAGTYNVVYADPPWQYSNKNTGRNMNSGAAAKYPTLSTDEICNLKIPEIIERDAVLFLWCTVPFLPDGLRVLSAWGFKYKTMITWRKIKSLGMGFWFRNQTEHLLLGVRGRVKAFRQQKPNIIETRVLRHSEKPEVFRDLIDQATRGIPGCRKIELFARKRVPGWEAWGNEVPEESSQISIQKALPFEELN